MAVPHTAELYKNAGHNPSSDMDSAPLSGTGNRQARVEPSGGHGWHIGNSHWMAASSDPWDVEGPVRNSRFISPVKMKTAVGHHS